MFCKTYPDDFTKGSFKIIGMITNHDVYETIPFRKKGMKDFSEVKINLSFAEFFASNRTDSRKRVNRKEKRRKKFDVENNPDKFWKLSKNNFILKEEIGGAKKKHPVHRAYLHPEFLRPKYLIAAAMAKYLPFVGIGKGLILTVTHLALTKTNINLFKKSSLCSELHKLGIAIAQIVTSMAK